MYSNLRTEAGWNNHLFIPSWLKIAGFQEDIVEILESDHRALQRFRDRNQLLTFFEFRRIASGIAGDFSVDYRHNGERKVLQSQGGTSTDPELMQGHGFFAAKLLRFRPISNGPHMEAMH